jgi:hypothetical protein
VHLHTGHTNHSADVTLEKRIPLVQVSRKEYGLSLVLRVTACRDLVPQLL